MDEDPRGIYVDRISSEDAKIIDQLTQPRSWDYSQFRKVLITLGSLGGGVSIPGRNRPDTIHLQGWREQINELVIRTKNSCREHGRVIFVDREKKCLVFGKTTMGSEYQGRLDKSTQPGRERHQRHIASIHTHPIGNGEMTAHGFSGQDYRTFLGDSRDQVMVITFGEDNLIMVLKTSVTPNNLPSQSVERRIRDCEQDYLTISGRYLFQKVVEFNKAVCAEMGLTMYIANKESGDLFSRVEVTK